MFVAPLDQQDVLSALSDDVAHLVVVLFHVFDEYLLARPFRTVDAHEQYVVACNNGDDGLFYSVLVR